MSNDWHNYFLKMAYLVASKSKDESMQCGCVVVGAGNSVLSTGYNGFPRFCNDYVVERHQRPLKYAWTEHAERNAIYNAARNGVKLLDSTLYSTSFPCVDCARGIVQSGIAGIIIPTKETDPFFLESRWDDWAESFRHARQVMHEGHVYIREIEYAV
jgi:dCMP deaminase